MTGIEVGEALRSDSAVLAIDHGFVGFDEPRRHDRRRPLLTAATRDIGDLATESGPVHGSGEVVPRLADRQLNGLRTHTEQNTPTTPTTTTPTWLDCEARSPQDGIDGC
jgi:hypothetical protein